jgi:tetratricopeptide (TPR) repeat protein
LLKNQLHSPSLILAKKKRKLARTPDCDSYDCDSGINTLAVDWNAVNSAMQQSRDGNHLQAIAMLSALLSHCDSNRDRAAILLSQSSCYSRLQNIAKSRELLESAKMCAIGERDLLSQVEMSEAALCALNGQNDLACEKFASVKSKYRDLLALPENDDFAAELDSQLACALVDAGQYNHAIEIFQALFKREELDDKQRLQLYFGVAHLRTGSLSEARSHLFEAMSGSDPRLAQSASDYLSSISTDPHLGTRLT